jgi:putative ABC transport system substrate-binding protein
MRRREFIAGLTGSAAWPMVARAQQAAVPVIGFLTVGSVGLDAPNVAGFRQGLNEGGYVEGRNIEIMFRYAEYQFDRLSTLASELVRRRVAVIVASGTAASSAAKAATATIPIVFECSADPVVLGLVPSLNRPGGNMTGAGLLAEAFYTKGLEFLHELLPNATSVALLTNPTNPANLGLKETEVAARTLGWRLTVAKASNPEEIEQTFSILAQEQIGGVIVNSDKLFLGNHDLLIALATRYRVSTIYWERDAVQAGGLMSYGASLPKAHWILGNYAARILKGEKPADLPVQLATKIDLVINLKTAKALGLTIPETLLATADEVIQ